MGLLLRGETGRERDDEKGKKGRAVTTIAAEGRNGR